MKLVRFRFVKPASWIGRLISWRLQEPWSHVAIIFDDISYSAEIPRVVKLPLTHKSVAIPPREGSDVELLITAEQEAQMREWCDARVGRPYDIMSVFGWILGWDWLQHRSNTYCYEFVRELLEHMGWLKPTRDLIKGNHLIRDINEMIARTVSLPRLPTPTGNAGSYQIVEYQSTSSASLDSTQHQ